MNEIEPCKKCKRQPVIKEIEGLFYAQCRCDKWNPYEHLGVSRKACINNWNFANTRNKPLEVEV